VDGVRDGLLETVGVFSRWYGSHAEAGELPFYAGPVRNQIMISRVLVPMDDSEMAKRALEYALENHPDAEITVLHVVGEPSPWGAAATALALETDVEAAAEERAEEVFDDARELAAEYGAEITTDVRLGHPARAIVNRADDFDAVVIGSHGGSLAERLVVGNVAEKVFRQSPVPVIAPR
jgi:nucleotide-binding universal stress UspA family protein